MPARGSFAPSLNFTGHLHSSYHRNVKFLSCLLLWSILPLPARATDQPLIEIHTLLQRVRAEASQHAETRGASAEFTTVKHQLRDWIEPQLARLTSDSDELEKTELVMKINDALKEAHLLCSTEPECSTNEQTSLGYLGDIKIDLRQRDSFLVLQTAIGVECGYDESAYVYAWRNGKWKWIWQSEQNHYTKDEYAVQTLHSVLLSPTLNGGAPLILTLGSAPWCSSNSRNVYYRLWRTYTEDYPAKLLLNGDEIGFLGNHDVPIQGSVGREDALIEFAVASKDPGVHNRPAVRHYVVHGNAVERIGPIALSPRDFSEEWLGNPWERSKQWSQPSSVTALQHEHDVAFTGVENGEFAATRHCTDSPDLWQVAFDPTDKKKGTIYFVIRWQPPYRFTMVRVSDHAAPACTEQDPAADDEGRTLFPAQNLFE